MKFKPTQIILTGIVACLLLCNIILLFGQQKYKTGLETVLQRIQTLKNTEFMFKDSKEITITRFKYEQFTIGDISIYTGSDRNSLMPVRNIAEQPKLVLGLNGNMCRPCVEGVIAELKAFFSDYETNENIICIADIEQRFKDNYYNKNVISFQQKDDFSLYEIEAPYFFILDKDLVVKLLFITDKTSPELTKEYLKIIKDRFPDI